jgi:hypothetical protein
VNYKSLSFFLGGGGACYHNVNNNFQGLVGGGVGGLITVARIIHTLKRLSILHV